MSAASGGNASALDVLTDDVRTVVLTKPSAALPSPIPKLAGSVAREIERLARLHAAGHLTAGEFAALKAAVLRGFEPTHYMASASPKHLGSKVWTGGFAPNLAVPGTNHRAWKQSFIHLALA